MPALLVALPVILVALFVLGLAASTVEQQNADRAARESEGFDWKTALAGVFGVVGALGRQAQLTFSAVISRYAGAKLGALTAWFHGLHELAAELERTAESFAATTADAFGRLITDVIPHAIAAEVRPVGRTARQALRQARAGRLTARAALAAAAAAGELARRGLIRVGHRVGQLDRTLDRVRGRVGRLERQAVRDRRRLAQLAGLLTAAGAASLVQRAMLRRGFRWWRCSAFNRVGRSLRCSHWAILEALLAPAFDVLTVALICRMLPLIDATASHVEAALRPIYYLTDDICEPAGATMPSATVSGPPARTDWLPTAV